MGVSFHQDKDKGDILVILQPALRSMHLSYHPRWGCLVPYGRRQRSHPVSAGRTEQELPSVIKVDSYTNKSGLEHAVWKEKYPLRLPGSPLHLAVLPEHVEVNFRSPEILCLTHRGVTFSAQIPTVNPKTLCNPFRSGLGSLKYKSETGGFTKPPRVLPLPGMDGYGMGRASEQKHAPE